SDEETDEYLAATAEPGSTEAEELSEEWAIRVAEACEAHSGDVLPYLDTFSAARDMDVLRAALGSDELDYLGYSYGTYLGASYAELYPDRVGRIVLDGAMEPSLTMNEIAAGQAEGFADAAEAFPSCGRRARGCPFPGRAAEARPPRAASCPSLAESPLGSGDPARPVTGAMARSVRMTLLYEDGLWQLGRQALSDAMKGDGAPLLNIAE